MISLKQKYLKQVVPALKKKFGYQNDLAVPRISKVIINTGINSARLANNPKLVEEIATSLAKITGQKPINRLARKSISGFKVRQGSIVGLMVTLRGKRMYDFIDKLINITLPRSRDFRGISPGSFDGQGNLTIGIREQIAFPEVKPDEVGQIYSLEITIVTTARNDEEGLELLKLLGFPFK